MFRTYSVTQFVCLVTLASAIRLTAGVSTSRRHSSTSSRRFTVADDIGLTRFETRDEGGENAIMFSPDNRYFLVKAERGLLKINRPESIIRLYRTNAVRRYVLRRSVRRPSPLWEIRRATYKDGPVVSHLQWFANSNAFAFLSKTNCGNEQLFVANVKTHTLYRLTPAHQYVTAFSIRDRQHFIYTTLSPRILQNAKSEDRAASFAGTGRFLYELLAPADAHAFWAQMLLQVPGRLNEIWAMVNGRLCPVVDSYGNRISVYDSGKTALSLSPSGGYAVTALPVASVPAEWALDYPPPYPASPYRIRPGSQELHGFDGLWDVNQYVLINLHTHRVEIPTNAPTGWAAGWFAARERAYWSDDERFVAFANTFLVNEGQKSRPCVAVMDRLEKSISCVESFKPSKSASYNPGYSIGRIHFQSGRTPKVVISHSSEGLSWERDEHFAAYRLSGNTWTSEGETNGSPDATPGIDISVEQSLNEPPVLRASDVEHTVSRALWEPNSGITQIKLGNASVYTWHDSTGREWHGILYTPPDLISGHRYPLVIQTHGFDQDAFEPSGHYPTAFAARALAGDGIVVLQTKPCPSSLSLEEGPCNVAGFDSAVTSLSTIGLIDADRVGLVGFSRTCFHVLEALTTGSLHFAAASITDGVNEGYLEYMMFVDFRSNAVAHEADSIIGAAPFGDGLQRWLRKSPVFNMDKVTTPLMVVAAGRTGVLGMWEPYAALRYMNKPVELIILNSDEHVLTNPAERMASQGGTVDWFRFWLQGYEDPDPSKTKQYERWRKLRSLHNSQASSAGAEKSVN